MSERKPPGTSFESWIDRQIREAAARGEFDDLPGAGKPLPGAGGTDDENWWLRNYLRKEGVETGALLPAALLLRKERDRLPETVRDLRSEAAVRAVVDGLNERIREHWRAPSQSPVPVRLADVEAVVARWRADRSAAAPAPAAPAGQPARRRRRWWRRAGDA